MQGAAQAQIGVVERGAHRRHGVAQREIGAVDGEHQDLLVLPVQDGDQGGRLAGRVGGGDGGDLERSQAGRDLHDLALVVAEVLEVGGRDDVVGQGRERLPHHRPGVVPHEHHEERGGASLPGAAARGDDEPARRANDEQHAEGGADGVGEDVAHAGVAAGNPLLQEFDREREQGAGGDHAQARHAGEGEGDAERDEQDQVGDQLGDGCIPGGEIE